jgi:hypothetical protein
MILCRELLCVKIKISAESDINWSAWQVSAEKLSAISAESDRNCQCWTCHLTLQSQTNSDTNFFIRETNLPPILLCHIRSPAKHPQDADWNLPLGGPHISSWAAVCVFILRSLRNTPQWTFGLVTESNLGRAPHQFADLVKIVSRRD